jgi:WD40 repeat protein
MLRLSLAVALSVCLLTALPAAEAPSAPQPLDLTATIPLPEISGRIDHMAVDVKGQRLFVSALGKGSVEVVDLAAGKCTERIIGLKDPQGILYIPDLNLLAVACGKDGTVHLYNGITLLPTKTIDFKNNADDLRYDPAARRLYVTYGDGGLGIIDPVKGEVVGEIPLKGHPQAFSIEHQGKRIFVNVPAGKHIAVIDREKQAVIATWPVEGATEPFPMALDETNHRLFTVTRHPSQVIVYDTETGKSTTRFDCVGDCDDIYYDPPTRRLYLSGGQGFADVFRQDDADHYHRVAQLPTGKLARTSLFVPELSSYYVAVPHFIPWLTGKSNIRAYKVQTQMADVPPAGAPACATACLQAVIAEAVDHFCSPPSPHRGRGLG